MRDWDWGAWARWGGQAGGLGACRVCVRRAEGSERRKGGQQDGSRTWLWSVWGAEAGALGRELEGQSGMGGVLGV